jgi:hypothetical protein
MVFIQLFRDEELLLSVSATKRPTLSADDAEECPTISKNTPAQHAGTLLPDSENVLHRLPRRLVPQGARPQRYRQRQNEISQDNLPRLQEPNQGKKLTTVMSIYLNNPHSYLHYQFKKTHIWLKKINH